MALYKWLYPGLRIKRWAALCAFGMVMCSMGFVLTLVKEQEMAGSLSVVLGIFCVIVSVRKIVKSVTGILAPNQEGQILNRMYQRGVLSSGPRIVALGGGTGLSALLRGLKERTSNITAIVTVTDDGGSSGRLRDQFDVLPPGDIRNCLAALADAEPTMHELLQFRFSETASDLSGHSLGNLFILALAKITGDFEKAVQETSRILNIRGSVVPATLSKVTLAARHADGKMTEGETNLSSYPSKIERIFMRPETARATQGALEAIRHADLIVLGPGSLYTSILPNLLIPDLLEAVTTAAAPRIYVCNVMTQPRETSQLGSDFDHVDALIRNSRPGIMTHCIVNTGLIPEAMKEKYSKEGSNSLRCETSRIRALGIKVVEADVIQTQDYVRHNPRKLAKIVTEMAK